MPLHTQPAELVFSQTWHGANSCSSFHMPQVRRASAREPRQDREGSSAKRWHASLRVPWGNSLAIR